MALKFIALMKDFIAENAILIGYVVAFVEIVKRLTAGKPWMKNLYLTIFGVVVGFVFVIPESGFIGIDWFSFIANGVALSALATGLYQTASSLAKTIRTG